MGISHSCQLPIFCANLQCSVERDVQDRERVCWARMTESASCCCVAHLLAWQPPMLYHVTTMIDNFAQIHAILTTSRLNALRLSDVTHNTPCECCLREPSQTQFAIGHDPREYNLNGTKGPVFIKGHNKCRSRS